LISTFGCLISVCALLDSEVPFISAYRVAAPATKGQRDKTTKDNH